MPWITRPYKTNVTFESLAVGTIFERNRHDYMCWVKTGPTQYHWRYIASFAGPIPVHPRDPEPQADAASQEPVFNVLRVFWEP